MRVQNTPGSYGLLAGLFVLLLGMLANAGCARAQVKGRDAGVAFDSVVTIELTCVDEKGETFYAFGSGVIVSPDTLLTAAHVAEDEEGFTCVRRATMTNGKQYLLVPGIILHDRDLASMHAFATPFDPTYAVVYGPKPAYGSRVCEMSGYPRVLWRCGEVQVTEEAPGDLEHTIIVEPGNSGSGVYDERGRLVGIITHRWSCSNGQICGGKMATLEGYVDELLGRGKL